MPKEPKSFIQSQIWTDFYKKLNRPIVNIDGIIFQKRKAGFVNYLLGSRFELDNQKLTLDNKKYCFLRLEPSNTESLEFIQKIAAENSLKLISSTAIQPKQTLVLDLSEKYENIIQSMKQKHRYNINLAKKHKLEVKIFSENWSEGFEYFWKLHKETADRQGFKTYEKNYFRTLLKVLGPKNNAHILTIYSPDKNIGPLATMILVTIESTATYLFGGSSENYKNLMAPYLLHSETIKFAQSLDCELYDFWGTDAHFDTDKQIWLPDQNKGSYGTTRFKLGFGGDIVNYPGCYDLVLKPFCYTMYAIIRKLTSRKKAFG